jgi:hypothetical protein
MLWCDLLTNKLAINTTDCQPNICSANSIANHPVAHPVSIPHTKHIKPIIIALARPHDPGSHRLPFRITNNAAIVISALAGSDHLGTYPISLKQPNKLSLIGCAHNIPNNTGSD